MGKVCLFLSLLLGGNGFVRAQTVAVPLTAAEIMAHVAANQDTAERARASYVYVQHARVISRKGSRVMCEEVTDSRVTPTEHGSEQHLLKLDGRLFVKGKYVPYSALPAKRKSHKKAADDAAKPSAAAPDAAGPAEPALPSSASSPDAKPAPPQAAEQDDKSIDIDVGDDDMDRDIVENMRDHMVNDTSRDGIGAGLFPLTSKIQKDYEFRLLGRQTMNGRDVFHLEFSPKDKTDYAWKGEAYIDATAFQPVVVRTNLSRKLPLAIRMLLGTNLPGLGFSVSYARQPDGIWFPASFGTEFKIHVLFFFRREIVISAENRDFEKTHVTSHILGDVADETKPENRP